MSPTAAAASLPPPKDRSTEDAEMDPLRARFGFLFGSADVSELPDFKAVPHPFHVHSGMDNRDYFRCMPWAATPASRDAYLRPEASWRSIPIVSSSHDDKIDGTKSTAKRTPRQTPIRRIQAMKITSGMAGSTLRSWHHVRRQDKPNQSSSEGTTTTDKEWGDLQPTTIITLGLLFDLLLTSSLSSFGCWEVWPGYAIDQDKKEDPRPRRGRVMNVHNHLIRDDETATLVTWLSVGCVMMGFTMEDMERVQNMGLWEPEPIEGDLVLEKETDTGDEW